MVEVFYRLFYLLVGSLIPSLLNTGSGCNKKENFFLKN